ncbi:aminopeptidase P family protein [Roseococcus sp. SDR]|uniref:aminopeptidase P family protein n=1 Tax=Roseococcus sp. SDR TaxID=2835532 RepID=UPI001BCC3C9A|nr:aminopeptidase P family protein [Roseococcus sp. SDR]MBS7791748.1 aminopeptidase P family protein [Roseococcus sp. SDR]MBV1847062.1 aminopeptidase P family protein [Roseococcus sp. SDR]
MLTKADRLATLRAALAAQGVDGFLVPRSDEHLGEYVPPSGERLAWLTGFTGSAGMAVVLPERAAVFTDGRYTTQVAAETDAALWERRHLIEEPPEAWLREHAADLRLGYDPWLHSEGFLKRLSGLNLVPLTPNPLDAIWQDRPAPPAAAVLPHGAELSGESAEAKREALAASLRQSGEQAALLADAHSVAWLLNLRGADLAHTPMPLAFALVRDDASVRMFLHAPERVPEATRAHLGNRVSIEPRANLARALGELSGRAVRVDADATPAWFAATLRDAGARVIAGEDPTRLPRATKNATEQQGARNAHRRDAVAVANFLAWFAAEAPKGGLTEISAAARLLDERRRVPGFVAESFPAISGAGENGAIVHYRVSEATNRPINADECYLIDSGGQYPDGTTDITRTLWSGPGPAPASLRARYTAVLRGHIALATVRFPVGVAGPHLDAIARRPLWDSGLDYDHGTGHGVGSFLSVHEGPVAFSRAARVVPIRPGMILSDEPGYYLPGHYGIRIENLLLAREAARQPDQAKTFLEFETLTLAPYCRALIVPSQLTTAERDWVNAYHARVQAEIGPSLEPAVREWLARECAPL